MPNLSSGKSSVVLLLLRLLDPCASSSQGITIDDLPLDKIDRHGHARDRKLFECLIVQILAEHWIELTATVFIDEIPVAAVRDIAKDPRRTQVARELMGAVIAIEPVGIKDTGHRTGTRACDHIDDDPILFQSLEDAEVGHPPSATPPEGNTNADSTEVMH